MKIPSIALLRVFFVALAVTAPMRTEAGRTCNLPAALWHADEATSNSTSHHHKPAYCFRDLGTLPGDDESYATSINDRGEVVGASRYSKTQVDHAFLYRKGKLLRIPPLPGDDSIAVTDINNAGEVVGNSVNTEHFTSNNPLRYKNGMTLPISGIRDAIPYAINDFGAIVGGEQGFGGFIVRNGRITYLGKNTVAYNVNNRGKVVGITANLKAFVYSDGKLTELGTLIPGDRYSDAAGVNERGEVVGTSGTSHGQAYLYRERTGMVGLGRLKDTDAYSVALAINDCGHVVGLSGSNVNFYDLAGLSAFIFASGQMTDLNAVASTPSGSTLTAASAINNRGQIVGRGSIGGQLHAFLLTPRPGEAGGRDNDDGSRCSDGGDDGRSG
jgi:probable HAF family extracellular repeat protein